MNSSELLPWGWDAEWEQAYAEGNFDPAHFAPGRVLSQREDTFTLITPQGIRWGHPAGILFHESTARERPGVGDWVVLEIIDCPLSDEASKFTVTHSVVEVLPRRSCFVREAPGGRGEAQVVACNVDKVFVVNPADDVNLNRIERMAVAIASGGAEPAVILSKGDLVDEDTLRAAEEAVRPLAEKLEVLCCGDAPVRTQTIRQTFAKVLLPGYTYALVGASGVGKSTLVNALMDEEVQETGAVRSSDGKGRHVTTFRELFPLANGALLMDTPGVREFGMWAQGDGLEIVFSDIETLQESCRFADCIHSCEPGCAVLEAVKKGTLSSRRLENWRSLSEELSQNVERQEQQKSRRERSQLRRKVKRDNRFSRK